MGQHLSPKALKALQGSIKKWENVLAGKVPDQGADNCPLCKMFLSKVKNADNDCIGCPVMKATGEPHCSDSPYATRWAKAEENPDFRDWAITDNQIVAARAELDFLRSLLPKRLQIKMK